MNNQDILDAISKMTVLELVELVKLIKDKFDLGDLPQVQTAAQGATDQPQAEAKTSFTVKMIEGGPNKIVAIKLVRQFLDLGLKDAKDAVDNVASQPIVLGADVNQETVDKIQEAAKDTDIKLEIS